MSGSADEAARRRAREDIEAISAEFRDAVSRALGSTLPRRLDALREAKPDWWDALSDPQREAFDSAVATATASGIADALRRLEPEDVWLEPLVAPGIRPSDAGWDAAFPEWITGLVRSLSPRRRGPDLGALDDPGNRIWLALLAAVRPLDAVLEEFGLEPAAAPSLGGGRYGLQPKTAEQLDPSGTLGRLWGRYRLAHQRFSALSRGRSRR